MNNQLVRQPYLVMKPVGGGDVMVYDGAAQKIHLVNEAAAFVLEQLQMPTLPSDLINQVVATFDVDLETAQQDVGEIVEQLRALDLIVNV